MDGEKLLIVAVICVVLAFAGGWVFFDISTVAGNEMGVKETWGGGVIDTPFQPKTYILFPGFTQEIYTYDMSSRVYVMNDSPSTIEFAQGREKDSYLVQSREGQDMHISMNVRWRLDPVHIVDLHKTVRSNFEEKLIRPVLMRVVKDEATIFEAIKAYSGEGLVTLQNAVLHRLTDPNGELSHRGIIVENFVIEGIRLDDKYIEQIKQRQVAIQQELRAHQEQKAALAEAEKAKAESLADKNRKVVEAERDKEVGILAAEKEARVMVVDSEAKKQREVLAAEAEREASVLRSEAIIAIGKAEAEAKKLALSAWAVPGADNFVRIEVANALSKAFQNIKGYVPQDMNISVLTDTFANAVDSVMIGMPSPQQKMTEPAPALQP